MVSRISDERVAYGSSGLPTDLVFVCRARFARGLWLALQPLPIPMVSSDLIRHVLFCFA